MITEEARLRIDPEFSALIPPLTPEELGQLETNLLAEGCRDPLVVWGEEGILLDGHNRQRICERHEIPFDVRDVSLADRDAAKQWIIFNQFGRRNLTPYQRAELALALKPLIERKAKENQRAAGGALPLKSAEPVETREELAKIAGVGHDTISKAEVIAAKAPEAVKQKLRSGEISIHAAYRDIKKAEQQEAKAQAKAAVPNDLPPATDRYVVHHGDLSAVGSKVADGSVDWIITDPPYGQQHISVYAELSAFASRVLKPGGSLICMTGQSFLAEVMEKLGKQMTYNWTLAYLTPGGQSAQLWGRKVNTFWKPLLWYVKGQYGGDWIGDVCRSDANDKRFHEWGQSESGMADIIERFTYPGQTVCDPFCGGGTTGVAAVRMNRLFVGIDSDPEAVATTLQRLAEAAGG